MKSRACPNNNKNQTTEKSKTYGDLDLLVVEDEGGVGASKFGRHVNELCRREGGKKKKVVFNDNDCATKSNHFFFFIERISGVESAGVRTKELQPMI